MAFWSALSLSTNILLWNSTQPVTQPFPIFSFHRFPAFLITTAIVSLSTWSEFLETICISFFSPLAVANTWQKQLEGGRCILGRHDGRGVRKQVTACLWSGRREESMPTLSSLSPSFLWICPEPPAHGTVPPIFVVNLPFRLPLWILFQTHTRRSIFCVMSSALNLATMFGHHTPDDYPSALNFYEIISWIPQERSTCLASRDNSPSQPCYGNTQDFIVGMNCLLLYIKRI